MKVEMIYGPDERDWLLFKQATLVTVGKDSNKQPTEAFKRKMLIAMHSPIRELKFVFRITDLPYWVGGHLVRHVHAQPYMKTQRNDRQDDYDRTKAPQDAPVSMIWSVNAEELMTISHKRLCTKASPETREVVKKICDLVVESYPEFKGLLVPQCEFRNGICQEFESCGRCDDIYASVIDANSATVHIEVSERVYNKAKRILLTAKGTSYGTLYYPDGDPA